MEVILKEDVPKLGSRGDVVKVAEGYGRNFCCRTSSPLRPRGQQESRRADAGAAVRRSAKEKTGAKH